MEEVKEKQEPKFNTKWVSIKTPKESSGGIDFGYIQFDQGENQGGESL